MVFATKSSAKTPTDALFCVPFADDAVSFHTMMVEVYPCPCSVTFVFVEGTITFSLG
jgi:hypothetical protein